MNGEILKRLDALAAKLGVTADHLWGVLIRQARIEAYEWIAWGALWLALSCLTWYLTIKLYKDDDKDGELLITMGIASLTTTVVGLICMSGTPGLLLNPEYWALKQVAAMLGGK